MNDVTIIFPHQLFAEHPALAAKRPVYLVEEKLYFDQFNFHRQKIAFHRATMKYYENQLISLGFTVTYVEARESRADIRELIAQLADSGTATVHLADPVDDWLQRRMMKAATASHVAVSIYRTPYFLNSMAEVADFFSGKKNYFMADFYKWQRQHRKILLDKKGGPLGGKWSFDDENRERFPKKAIAPQVNFPPANRFLEDSLQYVNEYYKDNYGELARADKSFPVTHADSAAWLQAFVEERFHNFGVYEDAMVASQHFLFHGVLTPMLNVGLLTPEQIVNAALEHASQHEIPLNSLEGFVRQIIGWREFVRIVYERAGREQRTRNYWKFSRKIPASFWTGTTGIVPVDTVISKVLYKGYSHHIERLMVMGNFMLLCEFDPDEVYRWFMEMYIDAYDWVMVPNVYGMTQFADGGLMTTKPYISGSNYLMKMGDWPAGPWQATWDGLFWRFMHEHRDFFKRNPRLGMLVNSFDKMPGEKQQAHLKNAEDFLADLDRQNIIF